MIITKIKLEKIKDKVIISAEITDTNKRKSSIFFEINEKYNKYVYSDASPFLAFVLFPAMKLGEDIYIEGSISNQLSENTQLIMNTVSKWNIGLKKISIFASEISMDKNNLGNIGCFFSGGVDSFSTYLKNKSDKKKKINHLILVQGFDIKLNENELYLQTSNNIKEFADKEKIELITIKTNLREFTEYYLSWDFAHGGALGSVALFLRNGFDIIYIPSSYQNKQLFPWGSHPDIDPKWSTEKMKIIHDGGSLTRLEKINKYIIKSPEALEYLRVCWKNVNGKYNCGKCNKCVRTMIELYVTDSLKRSKTFPSELDLEFVRNLYSPTQGSSTFIIEILSYLKKRKIYPELQGALEESLYKSSHPTFKNKIIKIIGELDSRYTNKKLYYFLSKRGLK